MMQYDVKWSLYFWKIYFEEHGKKGYGIKDPHLNNDLLDFPDHSKSLWMDIHDKHLAFTQSPASGKSWLLMTLFLNTWEVLINTTCWPISFI